MPIPKRPQDLTDKIVEDLSPQGGEFNVRRDQDSFTQGPGGIDLLTVTVNGSRRVIAVPKTDSIPQTEGPELALWRRK